MIEMLDSNNKRELYQNIIQFLNIQTVIHINNKMNFHKKSKENELDCKIYLMVLTHLLSENNKLKSIIIDNPHPKTILYFSSLIKPTNLKCINTSLDMLKINTENVINLSLQLSNNSCYTNIIRQCNNLKKLVIKSQSAEQINFQEIMHLTLDSFKLTGKFSSKLSSNNKFNIFLQSQAPFLNKLTIKIANRLDIIYKLNYNQIGFPNLKHLKIFTCNKFSNLNLPTVFNEVESIKIKSKILKYNNLINISNQLKFYHNLKYLLFIINEYHFPIKTQINTIYNLFNNIAEIKFK